jgi:hypothetical protein
VQRLIPASYKKPFHVKAIRALHEVPRKKLISDSVKKKERNVRGSTQSKKPIFAVLLLDDTQILYR